MKKLLKILSFSLILLICPLFISCGKSEFLRAEVTQDDNRTGSTLTYDYNKEAGIITIGGHGEQIEFYDVDILKGFQEKGNRIGLTFTAPNEVNDYETGTLSYQGITESAGKFYEVVNGQRVGRFSIFPLIKENEREFEIKITWQEGASEQVYKVKIADGTMLGGQTE